MRCFRGIDTLTAILLLAELHDVQRFPKARALMAYLGLVPGEHSSGDRHRRGPITKTGNTLARPLVVGAPWHYRHRPRVGPTLAQRRSGQPGRVIALERPPQFEGREFLTEEEVAALENGAVARNVQLAERPAESTTAGGSVDWREDGTPGFYNTFWLDGGTAWDPSRRTSLVVDPPDGRIPYTATARDNERPHGSGPWNSFGCGSFSSAAQAVLRRRQAGVLEGTWTRRGVVRRSGGGRWSAEGGGPYAVSEFWVVALIGERQVQPGAPCADRRDQCRQAPSDDPAARMMSSTTVTCGGVRGGGAREAVAMVIRRRTSTQQRASGRFSAASSGCRPS